MGTDRFSLEISREAYEMIVNHAVKGVPDEACGLIGGVIHDNRKIVSAVYLLNNLDHSSEHFSMDPTEQLEALKDLRKKGFDLLGNFHSHPETPARPSQEDIRLAYDSTASYLILSLNNPDQPILKAFQIINGQAEEEIIIFS